MRRATATPYRREAGELFGPRMTLFSELLAVGVCCLLASLPLVTAPTAFAAACRLLREAAEDGPSATVPRYVQALRAHGTGRTLRAGGALLLTGALLVADLLVTRTGSAGAGTALPGAALLGPALLVLAALALLVAERAAADQDVPREGWRRAFARAAHRTRRDPSGTLLLAVATVLVVLFVWVLPPLLLLAPGPLAFAVTAVERRAGLLD
ncbi:hypothetical protein AB0J21_07460 [Streptomyces sp. NPDC049954]|uniref:hypothetical protein n=1 Tax=Streptomyces sp. NPDC049954 TaxID=3155779 RepID=UPI00343090DE